MQHSTYWLSRAPGTQPEGPYVFDQLERMFSSGQLTASAQVCKDGQRDWHLLAEELEEPGRIGRSFVSTLLLSTGAFILMAGGVLWLIFANADTERSENVNATAEMRQRLNGKAPDQLWLRWQEAAAVAGEVGGNVSASKDPTRMEIVVSGANAEMTDYQARRLVRDAWTILGGKSATVILRDDTGKQMAKADWWSVE